MKKLSRILVAVPMLTIGSMVFAAENGGFAVGVKAGTLGAGVELNYPISSMITVNVGINKYSSSATDTTDGIDYDVDTNLQTIALLANFHPFAGSFRITAGAMINNNELKMTAADGSSIYSIGDADNPYALTSLEGKVDFKKIAPYAGVGWGFSSSSGFGFNLDLGILMQGEPNVSFTATGAAIVVNNPTFQAELAQEEASAEDDLKEFTMYPVVSAGINYRF